jgi:hypothetical protein
MCINIRRTNVAFFLCLRLCTSKVPLLVLMLISSCEPDFTFHGVDYTYCQNGGQRVLIKNRGHNLRWFIWYYLSSVARFSKDDATWEWRGHIHRWAYHAIFTPFSRRLWRRVVFALTSLKCRSGICNRCDQRQRLSVFRLAKSLPNQCIYQIIWSNKSVNKFNVFHITVILGNLKKILSHYQNVETQCL